jgi:uncharacterized OB-fold protein
MTWEPRPLPDVTPETRPYWEAAADERLLIGECDDCGLRFFYPRALCPDCFGDITLVEVEGTGEVYTYTVVRKLDGWPEEYVPIVLAYVELDAGSRMISNVVDCDPGDVAIGTRVEVRFVPSESGDIAIPVFAPVDAAE